MYRYIDILHNYRQTNTTLVWYNSIRCKESKYCYVYEYKCNNMHSNNMIH